jgi:hypothetical protein
MMVILCLERNAFVFMLVDFYDFDYLVNLTRSVTKIYATMPVVEFFSIFASLYVR